MSENWGHMTTKYTVEFLFDALAGVIEGVPTTERRLSDLAIALSE
jgi:hypothetical protein